MSPRAGLWTTQLYLHPQQPRTPHPTPPCFPLHPPLPSPQGLSLDHRGHSLEAAARVSWMGVWKGPSSPCYRRLDIKAYERAALPYAVNYFSSGQDCSRAIRCVWRQQRKS
jgi:hypothetical protein